MKRIVLWFMSTLSAVVILFGYKTSTSATMLDTANSASLKPVTITSTPTPTPAPTATTTKTSTKTAAAAKTATKTATKKTVTGPVVQTRWGPVQVQLTVSGGKVTAVEVLQYPSGGRSDQINAYALPILVSETMKAQSAKIDMVSGATYTSTGYLQSLQSALDQAGI